MCCLSLISPPPTPSPFRRGLRHIIPVRRKGLDAGDLVVTVGDQLRVSVDHPSPRTVSLKSINEKDSSPHGIADERRFRACLNAHRQTRIASPPIVGRVDPQTDFVTVHHRNV